MKLLKQYFFVGILLSVLIFSACTSQNKLVILQDKDSGSIENNFPRTQPEYRIQPKDILYIKVLTLNQEISDLINTTPSNTSNTFTNEVSLFIFGYNVNDSGFVEIPILGEVYVAGKTLDETKNAIKERAGNYLKDASVIVKLLSFKYSIFGEVIRPGIYHNYNNQLTVLEAISTAGNLTDFANRNNILVIRPTQSGTTTFRLDITDKKILSSDGFFLLPNDIVYVEPIRGKSFRTNIPVISLLLASVSSAVLILNYFSK
ncbi:MAG: polysaccharide biosynthesis/export family protein [Bacteroidales bacterium]|nr:polysaccharide biosynthesis/export family protein [Bacteroidales bacterium]